MEVAREEIAAAAERHSIKLIEHEAIVDHVQLLLDVADRASLSRAMHMIKGASARRVFQRLPDLKMQAGVRSLWQARYGWKEVPPEAMVNIREYIRTQWERLEDYSI